jgi:hypothetical protein
VKVYPGKGAQVSFTALVAVIICPIPLRDTGSRSELTF